MPEEVDSRLVLAYEESVRAWALQSAVLDELRNRTGILIATATVSSAFLGAQALGSNRALSATDIIAMVVLMSDEEGDGPREEAPAPEPIEEGGGGGTGEPEVRGDE
jgi:hypothetical protein